MNALISLFTLSFLYLATSSISYGAELSQSKLPDKTKVSTVLTKVEPVTEAILPTVYLKCTASSNANVNREGDVIELFDGQIFVITKGPLMLSCKSIHATLPKDAIVVMTALHGITKIHSLSLEPIDISANGYTMSLHVGQELIAADSMTHLQIAAQTDAIERRLASVVHFAGSDDKLLHCEYAPLSLMKNSPLVRDFFRGKNKQNKDIADRLLKMAASLAIATAGHGQYLPVAPDVVSQ